MAPDGSLGDLLSQLTEYQTSSSYEVPDNPYLTLSQIYFTKAEVENLLNASANLFYTKGESDALYLTKPELDAEYWRKDDVLRVPPAGGMSMGEFTNGVLP